MRRKLAVSLVICMLMVGCAGIAKMTPQERVRTFCNDFMTQYEGFHAESLRILANEQAKTKTKLYVARTINPRLNQLHKVIIDYCELAIKGEVPNGDQINAIIIDVTALFAEVRK